MTVKINIFEENSGHDKKMLGDQIAEFDHRNALHLQRLLSYNRRLNEKIEIQLLGLAAIDRYRMTIDRYIDIE